MRLTPTFIFTAFCLSLVLCSTAVAYEVTYTPFEKPDLKEIPLNSAPSDTKDEEQWMRQNGKVGIRNVTRPTLSHYRPTAKANGSAIIVAPGGGFLGLAIETEGWQIAEWLAAKGFHVFILKYRVLPTPKDLDEFSRKFNRMLKGEYVGFAPPEDTPEETLADGLAALRYVRNHAEKYGFNANRVGFMGFSAGGFLTRSVIEKGGKDAPNFAAPIYPSMTSMVVPENAPPLFVVIAQDDFLLDRVEGFPLINSYRAANKPVDFHLLMNGGHGFGLGREGTASANWMDDYFERLTLIGVTESAPTQ